MQGRLDLVCHLVQWEMGYLLVTVYTGPLTPVPRRHMYMSPFRILKVRILVICSSTLQVLMSQAFY